MKTFHHQTIDSTNTEAQRLLLSGEALPFTVTAQEQTAGRGRRGRSFYSPKDSGLYMTLCLNAPPERALLSVTPAAAVAVCEAIEALCDARPQIKWVNDIYLGDKKIAGILTEHIENAVIIGIGINLTTADFPAALPHAGALHAAVAPAKLQEEITARLLSLYGKDCRAFIDGYRRRFLLTGKTVRFTENGAEHTALALGADDACGLIIREENGVLRTLRSGEISIKEIQHHE